MRNFTVYLSVNLFLEHFLCIHEAMKFFIGFSLFFVFITPTFGYQTKELKPGNFLTKTFSTSEIFKEIRRKRSPNVITGFNPFGSTFNKRIRSVSNFCSFHSPLESSDSVVRKSTTPTDKNCIYVTSEESEYIFKASADSNKVCGIYIVTEPDKLIRITFNYFNIPCEDGGLVSVVDGWELQGQFFPGISNKENYKEFCGVNMLLPSFITSQNAGMLHYKLPTQRSSFSLSVQFVQASNPCDILVDNLGGIYTLKNYGERKNCTLMAIFPAKVKVLTINVGGKPRKDKLVSRNCGKGEDGDYVLVGGSEGLDSSKMVSFQKLCGVQFAPDFEELIIGCEITTVQLHSSGIYENSVSFIVSPLEEDLTENAIESTFFC